MIDYIDILDLANCPNHSASQWQSWFSSVQKPTDTEGVPPRSQTKTQPQSTDSPLGAACLLPSSLSPSHSPPSLSDVSLWRKKHTGGVRLCRQNTHLHQQPTLVCLFCLLSTYLPPPVIKMQELALRLGHQPSS